MHVYIIKYDWLDSPISNIKTYTADLPWGPVKYLNITNLQRINMLN